MTIRGTQTIGDANDLIYDFNTLINNTSFLTNKIKLISQQTLQHRRTDLGVGYDFMLLLWHQMLTATLAPFRSAEWSYLRRRNQMVVTSWRDNGNNG